MATLCPACSKTNPANANYCYYDGRHLSQEGHDGPLQIGTLPFPMPFCFSDGQGCANFNQLALACDERWDEARSLLADGIWPSFFSAIGRLDLVVAANQAAKEPDRDVGLSQLLEKFPADPNALRLPKLALPSAQEDLGTLTPGTDHKFELRITNQGMLVLRGMVTTDCDWLSFGDPAGGQSLKMFQTRNIYTLPVRVLGSKLRAGLKPLESEIVIDTNGGALTLPVRANVPVRPFPQGHYANNVLAGAKSPHELAVKAKAHPQEAALLFEQGAVKAWYASNGWTYPIQGTEGTGKGAVQQFFEALGLTKPPRLEIDTGRILCKGKPGKQLTKHVTISTKESRPVYAQAWSNQHWIKAGPGKSQGNTVTIPLQIEVPPRPGETLHADVTIQGNGKQQFIVPVTLAIAAARPDVDAEAEQPRGRLPLRWIFAGVGLLLVIAAGVGAFVMSRGNEEPENPPIVVLNNPAPQSEAWWDSIPDTKLAVLVRELKNLVPQDQAVFDGLAVKSDVERYQAYEKLAAKLPELVRNPKAKEPLGRLLAECCVFEPIERNMAPLRPALTSQIPRDGAEFRPEEKGEELERGFWSLQVGFAALTHKAIRPERARSLAHDLGTVFGFGLDPSGPPDELKAQTEKLLAVRCYRNTLLTASKSIEHALVMRALLMKKFPQHLAPAFREEFDVDLIAVGLSKGTDAWPKLEPILQSCLESNNLAIGLKIVDCYEQANPDLARKMERLLAAKWKAAANDKLTHAEKVAAIRTSLVGAAASAKISPAERVAQLQKLTSSSLSAVKSAQKKETALLQDTVRLAHASTMACNLFHKDAGVERFDELVAKVPEIEQAEPAKTVAAKPPDEDPMQPATKAGIAVGAQPKVFQGQLTPASERDPVRGGHFCKVYPIAMKAGQLYTIDLMSGAFDAYLRLEAPNGAQLAANDDGGDGLNSRIVFPAQADGVYRVIATTYSGGATGPYTLQVQQSGLGGPGGFGAPRVKAGKKGLAPGMMGGVAPAKAGPKANEKKETMMGGLAPAQAALKADDKKETQVSQSDLAKLDSKQTDVRVTAFNNLAGSVSNDLAPRHAQKIAKYLLVTIQQKSELDDVRAKLEAFAKCRHLLLALADYAGKDDVSQKTTEAIVGGVLGEPLRFARDEDWRSACRKMLLQRALDLTGSVMTGADQAAEILRDLYKEQGLALGIDDPDFLALTRPTQVLERVIKHVAAKAAQQNPAAEDKEYLEQIGRHLQVAQFIADNDLEHMVLLQRTWIKVLTLYVQAQAPAQAKGMVQIQQDLVGHDRRSQGVLDQLRAGEEKVLRIWKLAHNLK